MREKKMHDTKASEIGTPRERRTACASHVRARQSLACIAITACVTLSSSKSILSPLQTVRAAGQTLPFVRRSEEAQFMRHYYPLRSQR